MTDVREKWYSMISDSVWWYYYWYCWLTDILIADTVGREHAVLLYLVTRPLPACSNYAVRRLTFQWWWRRVGWTCVGRRLTSPKARAPPSILKPTPRSTPRSILTFTMQLHWPFTTTALLPSTWHLYYHCGSWLFFTPYPWTAGPADTVGDSTAGDILYFRLQKVYTTNTYQPELCHLPHHTGRATTKPPALPNLLPIRAEFYILTRQFLRQTGPIIVILLWRWSGQSVMQWWWREENDRRK